MIPDELPPDIDEYLEQVDDNIPIDPKGLDELFFKIRAATGLELTSIKIIVQTIFQEMRNQILKGNIVVINCFGKLFVSNPKTGNKKHTFIKFAPAKSLLKKIRNDS